MDVAGVGGTSWSQVEMHRAPDEFTSQLAATFVGWLIGLGLDRWLHTKWLYLAGLIVGIVAGFVELIRTVMSSESKE